VCLGLGSACLSITLALTRAALATDLKVSGPERCPDAAELAFRVERALGSPITESGPLSFAVVSAPARAGVPAAAGEQVTAASPAQSERWLPVVQAFLLADGGSLADPGLGMGIGTELRGARLALRARGMVLFEQRAGLGDAAPGAKLRLMLGSLSGCVAPFSTLRSTFAPFACAGWELGRIDGEGTGIAEPLAGHQLWTAPQADVGLTGSILGGALRLLLQVSVAAPLNRDDFCLRDLGCVYRPPGAVGRLSLGAELGFE
jgi:hypothetical protein